MIIPTYIQAISPTSKSIVGYSQLAYPKETLNKWYCFYIESRYGIKIPRYMSPTGWKIACYWWDSKEEVEMAFKFYGQTPLLIKNFELKSEIECNRLFYKQQENQSKEEFIEPYPLAVSLFISILLYIYIQCNVELLLVKVKNISSM